jgi:hypothetical protein
MQLLDLLYVRLNDHLSVVLASLMLLISLSNEALFLQDRIPKQSIILRKECFPPEQLA